MGLEPLDILEMFVLVVLRLVRVVSRLVLFTLWNCLIQLPMLLVRGVRGAVLLQRIFP